MNMARNTTARRFHAASCAWLAILCIGHGVAAQDVGSTEQANGAMLQRIGALEARIKELEERLDNRLTVKAPFVVTDAAGQELVVATQTASGASLLQVTAAGTSSIAALEVSSDATVVGLTSGGGESVRLVSNPDTGIAVEIRGSGEETAQLGVIRGKSRLGLWTGGKGYFKVGAEGGEHLAFGDSATPAFEIKDDADLVQVGMRKGQSALFLRTAPDRATLDVMGPADHRVEIDSAQAASLVSVRAGDGADSDSVQLITSYDPPNLELRRGGVPRAIVGTPDGAHPGLRVYDSSGSLALAAGLGAEGAEHVAIGLWDGDRNVALLGHNKKYPGEGLLQLARDGELMVELGRSYGADPGLRVLDRGGLTGIEASVDAQGVALVSIAKDGKVAASMAIDEGAGSFDVIHGDHSVATLNAKGDAGGVLALYDSGGNAALWASTQPGGVGLLDLFRGDAFAAQLGPGSNENTALRIYAKNQKVVAAIGEDAEGQGAVRVGNSAGLIVASMAASDTGGGVYALSNSTPVAGIVSEEGGGTVAVYNESVPVAYLTRSSAGDGGNVTATLNSGFGVFSAGAAQDGAGEACVNRRTGGGKEKVACLGIDLPSMGIAK